MIITGHLQLIFMITICLVYQLACGSESFVIDGHGNMSIELIKIEGVQGQLIKLSNGSSSITYDNRMVGVQPVYDSNHVDLLTGVPCINNSVRHPGNGGHRSVIKYKLENSIIVFAGLTHYSGRYGHDIVENKWWIDDEPRSAQQVDSAEPSTNAVPPSMPFGSAR